MSLFDTTHSGKASFEEVLECIGLVLRDHKALHDLLQDDNTFTILLKRFVAVVVWPIGFIILSAVVGLDLGSLLAPLFAGLLSFTFVFGQSLLRMWHAFLMIFVVRIFEVGDYVQPDQMQELTVETIGLLTTSGTNGAGKHVTISNWYLWERSVINLGTSSEYRFRVFFRVDANTTEAQLRSLEAGMRSFVANNEDKYRLKTFAFWLQVAHQGEKYFWDELDELDQHTIAFQVQKHGGLFVFFFFVVLHRSNLPTYLTQTLVLFICGRLNCCLSTSGLLVSSASCPRRLSRRFSKRKKREDTIFQTIQGLFCVE